MKYYEFEKDFDYYALIAAENVEDAKQLYSKTIDKIVENEPEEITFEQTKEKLFDSCVNNREQKEAFLTFSMNLLSEKTFLVVIDGGLLC